MSQRHLSLRSMRWTTMGKKASTPSKKYHAQVSTFLGGQKLRIMELFLANINRGFTTSEISEKTGIAFDTCSTRLRELKLAGLIRVRKWRRTSGSRQSSRVYETAEHAIQDFIKRMQAGGFPDKANDQACTETTDNPREPQKESRSDEYDLPEVISKILKYPNE